ncbi:MAG: sulfatase-like hydrolase/transferase [Azospirillum sp.]|nr:sulfatase-like hydrolase/transferase [Azospirillum sp.]
MRCRSLFASLLAGIAVVAAWPSLRQLATPARLNVIVLTVESFRADAVSQSATPNLWAAARRGLRFTNHRAVSAWTVPNIIAILDGLSPFEQGVHARGNYVPASWQLPLEDLAGRGWRVGGLEAFMNMDVYQNLGLDIEAGLDPLYWLAERASKAEPFVLWHHYLQTHLPYAPSPSFRPDWRRLLPPNDLAAVERIETVMRLPVIPHGSIAFQPSDRAAIAALHQGAVREFDAWFGEFWNFLEKSGLSRNTILVVTADHGDEHLEHGDVGHASTNHNGHLHDELVHVPLFLWLPPVIAVPRGAVVAAPTSHLDIMPTILRLLGVVPTRPLGGGDLLAVPPDRPWSGLTSRGGFSDPDAGHQTDFVVARVEGRWKLHVRRSGAIDVETRLYDLIEDPAETTDVAPLHPEIARRLRRDLDPELAAFRPPGAGDREGEPVSMAPRPRWVTPASSRAVTLADVADGFTLAWTGDAATRYVVHYQAGEGALELSGDLEVVGTTKAFGAVDQRYWETFVLPYRSFRLRVGVKGRSDRWSDWILLTVSP